MVPKAQTLTTVRTVLLVNRFYGGEHTPTGRMAQDVANALAREGHEVHVITSAQTYAEASACSESTRSIKVRIIPTGWGSSRLVHWVGFWLQAMRLVPFGRWDRCILLTDPPFMLPVTALCRLFGRRARKTFWWTMDL